MDPCTTEPADRGRQGQGGSVRPLLCRLAIVLAVVLHLIVTYSIARQPLHGSSLQPADRSLIWPLHNDTVHRVGPGADLFAVYHAGQALREGISPYSTEPDRRTPYFYPFRYLPLVAQTLGLFLTLFSPRLAYWIWMLVLEAALGLFLYVLLRRAQSPGWRTAAACLLLLSSPYFLELQMGQFTFLTTVLLGTALLLGESPTPRAQERRARIAGASAYTGAVLLKVVPAVTAPALVRQRRYWPHLAAALGIGLAAALPYFALHPADLQAFLTNFAAQGGGLDSGNYGLTYLLYRIAHDLPIPWMVDGWPLLQLGWRMFLLGVTALMALFSPGRRVIAGAGALLLAHFLSYLHVWEHHMSGVLVVGLLLLWEITENSAVPWRRPWRILLVAALLLLALPTPFALLDQAKDPAVLDPGTGWPAWARYALLLPKVLPTIVLYGVSMRLLLEADPSPEGNNAPGASMTTGS